MLATPIPMRRIVARLACALALAAALPFGWTHVAAQEHRHWQRHVHRHHDPDPEPDEVERPLPPVHMVAPDKVAQTVGSTGSAGGTWTQLTNLPPVALDNCLLATNGTVMCHQNGGSSWYRLTPSNTGSYQNGTWALDSKMQSGYAPLYFASAVLPDGHHRRGW
jgi:hypothetical protein